MFDKKKIYEITKLDDRSKDEFIREIINFYDTIDGVSGNDYDNLPPIIIIDGMDGSGKGTYKELVIKYLFSRGYEVISVKEPSNYLRKEILESINMKMDPWIITSLFILDRKHQFNMLSKRKFGSKTILLYDRSYLSTLVYQTIQGVPFDILLKLHSFVPKPKLAFITVCESGIARKRIEERYRLEGKSIDEFEKLKFIIKTEAGFRDIVNHIENSYLIDTTGESRDIPKIFEKIKKVLDEKITF